jgi:hypothetical protein
VEDRTALTEITRLASRLTTWPVEGSTATYGRDDDRVVSFWRLAELLAGADPESSPPTAPALWGVTAGVRPPRSFARVPWIVFYDPGRNTEPREGAFVALVLYPSRGQLAVVLAYDSLRMRKSGETKRIAHFIESIRAKHGAAGVERLPAEPAVARSFKQSAIRAWIHELAELDPNDLLVSFTDAMASLDVLQRTGVLPPIDALPPMVLSPQAAGPAGTSVPAPAAAAPTGDHHLPVEPSVDDDLPSGPAADDDLPAEPADDDLPQGPVVLQGPRRGERYLLNDAGGVTLLDRDVLHLQLRGSEVPAPDELRGAVQTGDPLLNEKHLRWLLTPDGMDEGESQRPPTSSAVWTAEAPLWLGMDSRQGRLRIVCGQRWVVSRATPGDIASAASVPGSADSSAAVAVADLMSILPNLGQAREELHGTIARLDIETDLEADRKLQSVRRSAAGLRHQLTRLQADLARLQTIAGSVPGFRTLEESVRYSIEDLKDVGEEARWLSQDLEASKRSDFERKVTLIGAVVLVPGFVISVYAALVDNAVKDVQLDHVLALVFIVLAAGAVALAWTEGRLRLRRGEGSSGRIVRPEATGRPVPQRSRTD